MTPADTLRRRVRELRDSLTCRDTRVRCEVIADRLSAILEEYDAACTQADVAREHEYAEADTWLSEAERTGERS